MGLRKNWGRILLLVGAVCLAQRGLWAPGWWQNHDPAAVLRLQAIQECFADGQIPCRWATQFGGGFGLPLFNFFAPFFYLVAYAFRLAGFGLVASLKLALLSFNLVGVISFYRLARRWFSRPASFAGAWLLTWAPFVALEVFVRGDLGEIAAIWLVPAVLLNLVRLSEAKTIGRLAAFVLSVMALGLTHNIQLVIFGPLLGLIGVWLAVKKKDWWLVAGGLIGLGLAAFFLLPAWLERGLVKINSLTEGYFDYRQHFLGGKQLFFGRNWGFGVSQPGRETDFSLQLGWPHWWPVILLPFVWGSLGEKFKKPLLGLTVLWVGVVLVMTRYSAPVWELISVWHFFQFPWRFLGLATLVTCGLAMFFVEALVSRSLPGQRPLVFLFLVLGLALNFGYFKPAGFVRVDESFLISQRWASVSDYLPKTVKRLPDFTAGWPRLTGGEVKSFDSLTNHFETEVEVFTDEDTILVLPVFDFAGWQIFVDEDLDIEGYLKPAAKEENEFGLLAVKLDKGEHVVTGWLRPTKTQGTANLISLVSLGLFWMIMLWQGGLWSKKTLGKK